jgi:GntR family transcriptional repressor for pyruvate dehydrogenase complex
MRTPASTSHWHGRAVTACSPTLTQAIRESLRIPNLRGFEGIVDWEGFSDLLRDQHGQILDAIEAGDADRAEAVVRAHIATASRTLPLTR